MIFASYIVAITYIGIIASFFYRDDELDEKMEGME